MLLILFFISNVHNPSPIIQNQINHWLRKFAFSLTFPSVQTRWTWEPSC